MMLPGVSNLLFILIESRRYSVIITLTNLGNHNKLFY